MTPRTLQAGRGLLALIIALAVGGCDDVSVTPVDVGSVVVSPAEAELVVGEVLGFTASVRDAGGSPLQGREVTWASTNLDVASVTAGGQVEALSPGTTEIRATAGGQTGSATVEVVPASELELDFPALELSSVAGEGSIVESSVRLESSGGGTITGLSAAVSYPAGEPEGWLSASLDGGSTPTTLRVTASAEGLGAGTFRGDVTVSGSGVGSPSAVLQVRLEVQESPPVIAGQPSALAFATEEGEGAPPPQTITVTNDGGGELMDVSVGVGYDDAPPAEWLQAEADGTTAPFTVTVRADPTGLPNEVYDGWVELSAPGASNSPERIEVRFIVGNPPARLEIVPSSLSIQIEEGANASASRQATLRNRGTGELGGFTGSVTYDPTSAAGWLSFSFRDDAAPTIIALDVDAGGLLPGTYGAVLLVASDDAVNSPQPLDVALEVLARPAGSQSQISVDPDVLVADGASASTVVVELRDARGDPLSSGGADVALFSTAGSLSPVTDRGDGTYEATLTASTQVETATITGSVNGQEIADEATVVFVPGPVSEEASSVEVDPDELIADGESTAAVTVQLRDENANPITDGEVEVTLSLEGDVGLEGLDLGAVTFSEAEGVYQASLTAPSEPGSVQVVASANGTPLADRPVVVFTTGEAAQIEEVTGGGQGAVVGETLPEAFVIRVTDATGNPVAGHPVGFSMSDAPSGAEGQALSTTSTVTNSAGEASSTLTLGNRPGEYEVEASASGLSGSPIEFTATAEVGPADPGTSTITADPTQLPSDGESSSVITVQLRDAFGNDLADGGDDVTLDTSAGTVGAVSDNGDGSYEATLAAASAPGTATITGTVNGAALVDEATVEFVSSGATDIDEVSGDDQEGTAGSELSEPFVVRVTDSGGSPVEGHPVEFIITDSPSGATGQTLSATSVVTNGAGEASSTLTLGSRPGDYEVEARAIGLSGSPVEFTATAEVGPADPGTSTITANPTQLPADGESSSIITVQLRDASGNDLPEDGNVVTLTTSAGTLGEVSNVDDGTYEATLIAASSPGTATITGTVNGAALVDEATVEFLTGDAGQIEAVSGGDQTETVGATLGAPFVVRVTDDSGNPVEGHPVEFSIAASPAGASGQALSPLSTTTNNSGEASSILTLGDAPGSYTVEVSSSGLSGSPVQFTATAEVGPADAGNSTISAAPTQIPADRSSTSTITVQLRDGFGNELTQGGDDVSLDNSAGTLGSVTDNGDGTYEAALTAASSPSTATITGTVNGATLGDDATVEFLTGDAGQIEAVSGSGQDGPVGSTLGAPFVVRVTDDSGNPVPGHPVEFSIAGSPPGASGQALSTLSTTTNNSGEASSTLTLGDTPGSYTVEASSAGLSGSPIQFTATAEVGPADPSTSTITANPTQIPADGSSTSTITAQLRDAFGNDLTSGGDVVSLDTSAGNLSAVSDLGDGRHQATLTAGSSPGTATITGSVNGAALADEATVTFVTGDAEQIASVSGNGQSDEVGSTLGAPFVVRVTDGGGNPVAGHPVSFSIAESPPGASGQELSTLSTTTNNSGEASATLTLGDTPGSYTVAASSSGLSGSPIQFTATAEVGPADPSTSTITANPTQIPADGSSTSTITVQLRDGFGNELTSGGDVVSLDNSAGSLSAVTDLGDGRHQATLTAGSSPGTATITGSVNGAALGDDATVEFLTGDAGQIEAVSGSGQDGPVGSTLGAPFVVRVTDDSGNPVPGHPVEFSIAGSPPGASGQALSTTSTTTNGSGEASSTLTLGDTPGSYTVAASSSGLSGSPIQFTATAEVGSADPSTSTITANPTQIPADGSSISTITVQLRDAFGNELTQGGDVVSLNNSAGTLGSVADNGDGTYEAALTAGSSPGTATITGTLNGAALTDEATVEFVSSGASQIEEVSGSGQAGPVGSTLSDPFVVRVTDSGGTPVEGHSVEFSIAGSPSGASGQELSTSSALTNGSGEASSTLSLGDTPGAYTVEVSSSGLSGSPVQFTATAEVGPADPGTSTISANPTELPADGSSTSTIIVQLRDAFGNELNSGGDDVVLDNSAGSLSAVTDLGDGRHQATLTAGSSPATATITGSVNGAALGDDATVEFLTGDAGQIEAVSGSGQDGPVGSTLGAPFVVRVTDDSGNPVAGHPVSFSIAGSPPGASGQALSTTSTTTNGSGEASSTLTLGDTPGSYTVAASSSGLSGSPIQFTATAEVGPADPSTSTITANPTQIPADGSSVSTITVQLRDAFGNELTQGGDDVSLNNSAGTLGSVTDNGDGTYEAALTAGSSPGTATITGTLNGAALTDDATVEFVSSGASQIEEVSGGSQAGPVGSTLSDPFVVRVTDSGGNPVEGHPVEFSIAGSPSGASGQGLSTTSTTTNNSGEASSTLTLGDTPGAYTVEASSSGLSGSPVTFTATAEIGPADPGTSTISANPTELPADGSSTSTILVQLRDAFGNELTQGGDDVQLAASEGELGSVSYAGDGRYQATLAADDEPGTATITGSVNGAALADEATVTFVTGNAEQIASVSGNGQSDEVGSTLGAPFVVRVTDGGGNPVAGHPVSFSIAGGPPGASGQGLSTTSTTTNGSGEASSTLTLGDTPGAYTVEASSSGLSGSPVTFTATAEVGAADPGTSTISASPTELPADGSSTSTITVQLRDAFGNELTSGGDDVVLGTSAGSLSEVSDLGDGRHQATLTAGSSPATATITGTLNGAALTDDATVEFVSSGATNIEEVSGNGQAGPVGSTLSDPFVVRVTDSGGNPIEGRPVEFSIAGGPSGASGQALSTTSTTTNGSGEASSTLTLGDTPGAYRVEASSSGLSGSPVTFSATAEIGPADPSTSTISANPTELPADGSSTSTITVQLRDAFGNELTSGGDDVVLGTSAGSLSGTTDLGDGRHQATLTAGSSPATATITGRVNGAALTDDATVEFVSSGATNIEEVSGNGQAGPVGSTLSDPFVVRVTDSGGTPVEGHPVEFSIAGGPSGASGQGLSTTSTTTNGSGEASSTLTLGDTPGAYTVEASSSGLSGSPVTFSATAEIGPADPSTSTISASPTELPADGSSTSTITVQLRDAFGNEVSEGGDDVVLGTSAGSLSGTTDLGDGRHQATLTADDEPGTATITGLVNGAALTDDATVEFISSGATNIEEVSGNGQAGPVGSTLSDPFVVRVTDSGGTPVEGHPVEFSIAGGPSGASGQGLSTTSTTTNGSGEASSTLTLGDTPGAYRVEASSSGLSGSPVTFSATAEIGPADPSTSTISASPTELPADGSSTSTITVQLRDAFGNELTSGGDDVVLGTSAGSLSEVSDLGDGRHQATLTADDEPGTATITGTVNGAALTDDATVEFVSGEATDIDQISGDGQEGTVGSQLSDPFVVQVTDDDGVPVAGHPVEFAITETPSDASGQALSDTSVLTDSDGEARSTLTLGSRPGDYEIEARSNGLSGSPVEFTATAEVGPADEGTSTISASPTELPADGSSTSTITVQLRDGFGNELTDDGDDVDLGSSVGGIGSVSYVGGGRHQATLTAADEPGTATITGTVNGVALDDDATVEFISPSTISLVFISAEQEIEVGGTTDPFVVELQDENGEPTSRSPAIILRLSSSSAGVFLSASDDEEAASVTLPAGRSRAQFRFTTTVAALHTITVTPSGPGSAGLAPVSQDLNVTEPSASAVGALARAAPSLGNER